MVKVHGWTKEREVVLVVWRCAISDRRSISFATSHHHRILAAANS